DRRRSPGPPAEVDELVERHVGLASVAVAERGAGAAAPGRVDVDGGEAEPPLDRPLDPPEALHLLERHPRGDAPEPARRSDDAGCRRAPGEVAEAKRRLQPGATRRPRQRGRALVENAGEQRLGLRAGPDRQERPDLPRAPALALLALVPREHDVEAAP